MVNNDCKSMLENIYSYYPACVTSKSTLRSEVMCAAKAVKSKKKPGIQHITTAPFYVKNIAAQINKIKTLGEVYTTFNNEQRRHFAAINATNLMDPVTDEAWYRIGGCEWLIEKVLQKVIDVCLTGSREKAVSGCYSLLAAKVEQAEQGLCFEDTVIISPAGTIKKVVVYNSFNLSRAAQDESGIK